MVSLLPSSTQAATARFAGQASRHVALVMLVCLLSQGCTSTPRQTEFASPDVAVESFATAVRERNETSLKQILGPEADDVLWSGDKIADQQAGKRFLAAYDEKHAITAGDTADTKILVVGAQDWPMPIPLVRDEKTGQWRFDTPAGKEEVINRRIGRNELDVIETCKAFVDAQLEFARRDPEGDGYADYASKVWSEPGKHDGLYWPTNPGEPPSPLGPFMAEAFEEGYRQPGDANPEPQPYHGYYFRFLTSQGPHADGGARDYIVNGNLIGGFALVAFPAEYDVSGIMTFMVNQDGIVYQADLGPDTKRRALEISSFDPGAEWSKVAAESSGESAAR